MITDKRSALKRVLETLTVFFFLLCFSLTFASCSKDDDGSKGKTQYDYIFDDIPEITTEPQDKEEEEKRYCDVIVSSDCSAEIYVAAANLASKLGQKTEMISEVYYEYEKPEVTPFRTSVYIGVLDEQACRRFYKDYRVDDYGYARIEEKILVGGVTDASTLKAITKFTEDIVNKATPIYFMSDENFIFRGTYEVEEGVKLNGFALSEYLIVYQSGNLEAQSFAAKLGEFIEENLGYALLVVSEGESDSHARSICVGRTERADTEKLAYSDIETYILPYSTGISLISDSTFGMNLGFDRLCEMLCEGGETQELNITLPITIAYDISSLNIVCMRFEEENLGVSSIIKVRDDIVAAAPDIARLVGLSERSFDYVLRNLANSYSGFSVVSECGECVHYLYSKGMFTAKTESIFAGDSELILIKWSLSQRYSDFILSELFANGSAKELGGLVAEKKLDRLTVFGRFFGDEEDDFLTLGGLVRVHNSRLPVDVCINDSFVSIKNVEISSGSLCNVFKMNFNFYSK